MNKLSVGGLRILSLLIVMGLAACNSSQEERQPSGPVAFHEDDECHVCGMMIESFPGPKGQAIEGEEVRKFCSVAEMLGWWLQPEHRTRNVALYVHDMGRSDWNAPDDRYLIDATQAYYVVSPQLKGAMGVVLASFSDAQVARQLADEQGGRVLRFDDIDQALLMQTVDRPDHVGH
ncbi:nitrous oxide reductase accessory protein NosL [Halomonas shantousis]